MNLIENISMFDFGFGNYFKCFKIDVDWLDIVRIYIYKG